MESRRNDQQPEGQTGQLARLSELEYEMEEGQPDIIGWKVVDENGNDVARVDDLLVDLDTGAIMLAVLTFDTSQTLVPIEAFGLDANNQRLVPSQNFPLPVDRQTLEQAPKFTEQTEDIGPFFDYWGGPEGYEEYEEYEEEEEHHHSG